MPLSSLLDTSSLSFCSLGPQKGTPERPKGAPRSPKTLFWSSSFAYFSHVFALFQSWMPDGVQKGARGVPREHFGLIWDVF